MVETLLLVRWPLLGAVLTSLPLAYYGVFLVERRMVYVSVTLAQAALLGAAAAFCFGLEPRLTGLATVVAVISVLAWRGRGVKEILPEDALLGVLYVVMGGLSVIFFSKSAQGGMDEATLLFGSMLGISSRDVSILFGAGAPLAAISAIYHRRFLAASFDPETCKVLGMPVGLWELLFFSGLGIILAVAISQIGVLLSFAYLVLPPASARSLFRTGRKVFFASAAIGAAGSVAGTLASIQWDVPTGAAICLALALPLPFALILRRR